MYFKHDPLLINAHPSTLKNFYRRNRKRIRDRFKKFHKKKLKETLGFISQSGKEAKEYGVSKFNRKMRRKQIKFDKVKVVLEEMSTMSLDTPKKREKKKKVHNKYKHMKFKSQAGEFTDSKKGVDMKGFDIKTCLPLIEAALGVYIVNESESTLGKALGALLALFQGSISNTVFDYISKLFGKYSFLEEFSLNSFSEFLKQFVSDFEAFKLNKYAQSFFGFVGEVISMFFCPSITEKFNEYLTSDIAKKIIAFCSKTDIASGILESILYIVNAVNVFVETGTLRGFVSTETISDQMEERLSKLRCDWSMYRTGDLEFLTEHKQYTFLREVYEFKATCERLRHSKRGFDQSRVTMWIKEANEMIVAAAKVEAHRVARKQPYLFLLVSGTGINKSHLTRLIVKVMLEEKVFHLMMITCTF